MPGIDAEFFPGKKGAEAGEVMGNRLKLNKENLRQIKSEYNKEDGTAAPEAYY